MIELNFFHLSVRSQSSHSNYNRGLKLATAGVAIMALGAVAASPDCDVKIVPCGMNYFHAHKFRSRAVIEFGHPLEVPPELVELYKKGDRREAVRRLLETIYQALVAVTVTSPDYDTLMVSFFRSTYIVLFTDYTFNSSLSKRHVVFTILLERSYPCQWLSN